MCNRDKITLLALELLRMCQGSSTKEEIDKKIVEMGELLQETEYEMHPDGVKEIE